MNPLVFIDVWQEWPNKKNKEGSEKAFIFGYKQKWFTKDELLACIRIFKASENETVKANQELGNWIRDQKYTFYLDKIGDEELALKEIGDLKKQAIEVCRYWNQKRRPWWQEVVDLDGRARQVQEALRQSEFFRNNWEEGIDRLRILFHRRRHENEYLQNLTPSIQWFSNIEHNVIAKIMEGEYGRININPETPPKDEEVYMLGEHELDLLKVVKDNLTLSAYGLEPQPLTRMGADYEPESAPWYVLQTEEGWALKYKGTVIDTWTGLIFQDGVMRNCAKAAYNSFAQTAKTNNEARYEPDIEHQKKIQEENKKINPFRKNESD